MTSLRLNPDPKGVWLAALIFAFLQPGLLAQDKGNSVPPSPLEELNPALRPLVQSAAANSWRMDLQDILVKRAEALSMRYGASKDFRVSASLRAGFQRQDTATRTVDGTNYRFEVRATKPLYTWGAAEADRDFGLLEIEKVKQNRQLAFLIIYRDVVTQFINLAVLKQRVLASQLAEEIIREDVELKRGQVERGEFPETQFASVELNHKQELLKHEALVNSMMKTEADLGELIGLEAGQTIDVSSGVPAVSNDLLLLEGKIKNFIASLDTDSLKVGAKQARLDQELKLLRKAEVNQRPKLNGLLTVRRDADNVITGDRRNLEYTESFAGLELSWNIYDGKFSRATMLHSLESRRQLERELEDMKRDIANDLEYYLTDLQIKRDQSLISDQKFSWEEGRYRQAVEDVKSGRSPEKELKVVKRDLEQSRFIQYDSRGYYYKTLTLLYVMLESPSILAYLEE